MASMANPFAKSHSLKSSTAAHFCSMCGPIYCSMKFTDDIRAMAAERPLELPVAMK